MGTRSTVRLLAAAAVALGVAIAAGPAGGDGGEQTRPVANRADAPPTLAEAFGIFRREREPEDALPREFVEWVGSPDGDPALRTLRTGDSRLGLALTDRRFYLIPRAQTDICLLTWRSQGGTSMGCAPVSSAADEDTPLLGFGPGVVEGLIPDGTRRVRVRDGAGRWHPLRVGENVVSGETAPSGGVLEWTSSAGAVREMPLSPR